jgi:8-oxo-dGTP pyrophosphatase MutT (NUDIX family)
MPLITLQFADDLDMPIDNRPWSFAIERSADIDANWARLLAELPALFNGRVLLMRPHGVVTASDGRRVFRGTWFETDYKAFLGHRDLGVPDTAIRNGFAMAAVRTTDGGYLLGEMAGHTAIAGQCQFAAGTPDPSDIRSHANGRYVDLAASAVRELGEETGITAAQVSIAPGWSIVTEGPKMAFMRSMQLALTSDDAVAQVSRFIAAERQPEFSQVFAAHGPADVVGRPLSGFMRRYLEAQWAAQA